mmetsp:Transcript_73750/g.130249  ORF Transcript_73750/g.130249 Transcript_73750/m.130249 type:complete len:100 (-) Transcript_73750:15-314(-)
MSVQLSSIASNAKQHRKRAGNLQGRKFFQHLEIELQASGASFPPRVRMQAMAQGGEALEHSHLNESQPPLPTGVHWSLPVNVLDISCAHSRYCCSLVLF